MLCPDAESSESGSSGAEASEDTSVSESEGGSQSDDSSVKGVSSRFAQKVLKLGRTSIWKIKNSGGKPNSAKRGAPTRLTKQALKDIDSIVEQGQLHQHHQDEPVTLSWLYNKLITRFKKYKPKEGKKGGAAKTALSISYRTFKRGLRKLGIRRFALSRYQFAKILSNF